MPYLECHLVCGFEHGTLQRADHGEGRFRQIDKGVSVPSSLPPSGRPWVQHAYVATTRATQGSGANARHQLPSAWAHADTARANAKSPTPVEWPTTACRAHQLQWYASAHTRTMGNPMMQRICSGTSTSTTAPTQRQSNRAYPEGYFGGAGKVSVLERCGRGG